MKLKVAQSRTTLCNPMDYIVHGILQARILEWVAVPFSRGSSHPGIKPRSPALQAGSLPVEPPGKSKNTGVGLAPSPVDLPDQKVFSSAIREAPIYVCVCIYIYIFWLCWVFCYCTQAFSRCSEQRLLVAEHRL